MQPDSEGISINHQTMAPFIPKKASHIKYRQYRAYVYLQVRETDDRKTLIIAISN